jgi:hypothetical protein
MTGEAPRGAGDGAGAARVGGREPGSEAAGACTGAPEPARAARTVASIEAVTPARASRDRKAILKSQERGSWHRNKAESTGRPGTTSPRGRAVKAGDRWGGTRPEEDPAPGAGGGAGAAGAKTGRGIQYFAGRRPMA